MTFVNLKWHRTLSAVVGLSLAFGANNVVAQEGAPVFSEDELLILDMQFERYRVGSGLEGYLHDGEFYFALIDLVSHLQVPIEVREDGARGRIVGKTSFNLDWRDGAWVSEVDDKAIEVKPGEIVSQDGILFVSRNLLSRWFPLTLSVELADSLVELKTSQKLPFESAIDRKNRVFASRNKIGGYENPILDVPYKAYETPSINVRLTQRTVANEKEDVDTTRSTFYSVISNGDIGYMSSNLFINGSRDDGINNVSLRFDRYDSERSLLGPLNLGQISFGDIDAPGARSSNGRGFLFSNESTNSRYVRDFTTIEGNHYPGWEVELHLDGAVIDYQIVGNDGRYQFDDVLLSQGENEYELVFYGPTGEKEVESRTLYVGEDSDDINRLRYSLSVVQPQIKLYSDDSEQNSSNRWQTNLVTRYSPTKRLAFKAAYSRLENDEADLSDERIVTGDYIDEFYEVSASTFMLGQSLSVGLAQSNDNPFNLALGLGGGNRSFNYRLSYLDNAYGEEAINEDVVDSQISAVVRARLNNMSGIFSTKQIQFANHELNESELVVSGKFKGLQWSKGFEYEERYEGGEIFDELTGDLFLGTKIGPLFARASATYITEPQTEFTTYGLAADLRLSNNVDVSFNYDYDILQDENSYRVGMKWSLPYLIVTPNIRYSDSGLVNANLTMLLAMGARSGGLGDYYVADRRSISSRGTLRARLFEDTNNDGVYNLGERLLSGGVIHSLQTRQKAVSDETGVATITNVRAWFPSDIVYESDSVDEYAMRYGGEEFSIEMRPGSVMEVDLPFYRAGDIDGTVVRTMLDGDTRPARGVTVELFNADGEITSTTVTASDGFYSFQRILPGHYRVAIRGELAENYAPQDVYITKDGSFVGGVNLVINKQFEQPNQAHNSVDFLEGNSNLGLSTPGAGLQRPPVNIAAAPAALTATPIASPQVTTVAPRSITPAERPLQQPTANTPAPIPVTNAQPPVAQAELPLSPRAEPVPELVDPWSLQLGSFSNATYAEALIDKLRAQGTPYFTRQVETARGSFTRVFAGPFNNRDAAASQKSTLDASLRVQSLLIAAK